MADVSERIQNIFEHFIIFTIDCLIVTGVGESSHVSVSVRPKLITVWVLHLEKSAIKQLKWDTRILKKNMLIEALWHGNCEWNLLKSSYIWAHTTTCCWLLSFLVNVYVSGCNILMYSKVFPLPEGGRELPPDVPCFWPLSFRSGCLFHFKASSYLPPFSAYKISRSLSCLVSELIWATVCKGLQQNQPKMQNLITILCPVITHYV